MDHSGKITVENLRSVLGEAYAEEEAAEMIREADIVGDGCISFDEFCVLMRGQTEAVRAQVRKRSVGSDGGGGGAGEARRRKVPLARRSR